jgi:dipeptidyl aminopeptidase/acylaminoacyl peptidase
MKTFLPRKILFGHPEISLPKISPNGKYISYLAPEDNNLGLILKNITKDGEGIKLNTDAKQYSIENYEWAHTNDDIIYWHDEQGDENWALYAINLTTQKNIRLTPPKTQAKIIKLSSHHPNKIAILLNNRNPAIFDVCLVNIHSAELELVYSNKEYIDIYVDQDFNPKIGIKPNSDGSCRVDCINQDQTSPFTTLSQLDFLCHYMFKENRIGLNARGDAVFLAQSIDTDKAQLVRYGLEDKLKTILAHDSHADYQDIIFDNIKKEPIAVAFNYHKKNWQILDSIFSKDIKDLINQNPNHECSVLSQSEDNTVWLIGYQSDTAPTEFELYFTQSKVFKPLFSSDSRFSTYQNLAKQQCLSIPSQDNFEIPCYLSLPTELSDQPNLSIPLILWIHGGPNSRDFWGFNPIHQWLTNRGYAVLSINFRGSTGYGLKFLQAGNGEWGGKIADDIQRCAEWVSEKYTIINKNKIAIMGRSFGGYSALMGLAKYPELYACGADWVGPTNLNHFLDHIPPYWKIVYDMLEKMVGSSAEIRALHSPDSHISAFKKPLLKAHGAHDVRVNQTGPDVFIDKLAKYLPELWYATFPDEGHRFIHANNKIAFYALVEAFAAKYLGGELETIEHEIENSSIIFKQGNIKELIEQG